MSASSSSNRTGRATTKQNILMKDNIPMEDVLVHYEAYIKE